MSGKAETQTCISDFVSGTFLTESCGIKWRLVSVAVKPGQFGAMFLQKHGSRNLLSHYLTSPSLVFLNHKVEISMPTLKCYFKDQVKDCKLPDT